MPEGKRPDFSRDTVLAIARAIQAWDRREPSNLVSYAALVDAVIIAFDSVERDMGSTEAAS